MQKSKFFFYIFFDYFYPDSLKKGFKGIRSLSISEVFTYRFDFIFRFFSFLFLPILFQKLFFQ